LLFLVAAERLFTAAANSEDLLKGEEGLRASAVAELLDKATAALRAGWKRSRGGSEPRLCHPDRPANLG
jgi:hypothetical protein